MHAPNIGILFIVICTLGWRRGCVEVKLTTTPQLKIIFFSFNIFKNVLSTGMYTGVYTVERLFYVSTTVITNE